MKYSHGYISVVELQLSMMGAEEMEQVKESFIKRVLKKLWTIVKPFLPAIAVIIAIITVVFFTYLYFTCTKGSIPADRIVNENAIKKSDWLMFWGSILAVFCTLSLALVTYRQNNDLHKSNVEREKKDTFFAKMRFAAEFYSLIEFETLSISVNTDKTSTITMELIDTGKTPPSFISIEKFTIRLKEEFNKKIRGGVEQFEVSLVHQTKASVKLRDNRRLNPDNTKRKTIHFNFEAEQTLKFQDLYGVANDLAVYNNDYHFFERSYISLVMVYIIENSLNVQTAVKTIMTLKASMENMSVEEYPDRYKFIIVDKAIESVEYSFIGEIK